MARGKQTRKCHQCGIDDTKHEEMEFITVGEAKPVKKYYHKGDCYNEYLKHKTFKEEEQVKKDKLNEVIKEIYGVKEIPSSAWTLLEKLRNGNNIFGSRQKITKRYKEGYSWDLIRGTFEYCSDTIEYHNANKSFNGFMGAFKYALAIIVDKIYIIEQREEQKKKQDAMVERQLEKMGEEVDYTTNYKKPSKSNVDISRFLDD